ncbi:MAG: dodecin domain-containing protein [Candidatus Atribacteria bacterium]|nr:dodecin domain-containing protein [Candidatus Atribacteria bacterium]
MEGNVMSVYKVIELIGTSQVSWEEAAKIAIDQACKTLKDLRVAEVVSQDMKIEEGKVVAYRTKVRLSFRFHGE